MSTLARMRTVKPALRTSRVVASWPMVVRYAWVLLWGYLDDEGRGLDIPKTIAGDLFPLDEDITGRVVDEWIATMSRAVEQVAADGTVEQVAAPLCRYVVGGRSYIHAVNWHEHQKPNRPTPSQHPACPVHDVTLDQATIHLSDSVDSVSGSVSDSALEGLRVRGFEGLRGAAASVTEPPRGCSKHPNGTRRPCRACGELRKAAEEPPPPVRKHPYVDDGTSVCAGCRLPQANRAHR